MKSGRCLPKATSLLAEIKVSYMAQILKKAVLSAAVAVGFASMAPAEEPLINTRDAVVDSNKPEDNTDSMLMILGGMVAAGLLGVHMLTRKGKMFDD